MLGAQIIEIGAGFEQRRAARRVFDAHKEGRGAKGKAAITHNIMPDAKEKTAFTFGLYMRTFYAGRIGEVLEALDM